MKLNNVYGLMIFGLTALYGCSSTVVVKDSTPLPVVPEYVKVPHPAGFDQADLQAIFHSPLAPKAVLGEFADTCDDEFRKLGQATHSIDEKKKGAMELVTQDPERMHWCFYAKIVRLQETLQGNTTWNTRQKKVVTTFEFLSPVANAYLELYHDSRYLRWASMYYSKISEWVFFKKVVPTPDSTLTLVKNAHSDLEPWVPLKTESEKNQDSVFAKYGITLAPTIASSQDPMQNESQTPGDGDNRVPASVDQQQNPVVATPDNVSPEIPVAAPDVPTVPTTNEGSENPAMEVPPMTATP
jgi:hypothetical protein